jgi:hypothetical protein
MAQDLTVNIKTTSDVPQAMDKAKTAASGFDKQVGDIGRKFSTAFKDIALGFIAPMVIVNQLVSFISQSIEDARRSAQEGFDLIAKGETKLATTEQTRLANFLKIKAENKKEAEDVEAGMKKMAMEYSFTKEGKSAQDKFLSEGTNRFLVQSMGMGQPSYELLYKNKEFQKRMLDTFLQSEEGKKFAPIFKDKDKDFKGPEGFGNVIGVGPNPVMEAMARQIEIQEQQLAELQKISGSTPAGQGDFTKGTQSK